MTLNELGTLLAANPDKKFLLKLPDDRNVPVSFHVTEVGQVVKTFIDCGGTVRTNKTCLMQVWVGPDEDHRLLTGKLAGILKLSRSVISNDNLPLEIEYEDAVISQYPVDSASVTPDAVVLNLSTKHTDCLAKEKCGIPSAQEQTQAASCCGPKGCC